MAYFGNQQQESYYPIVPNYGQMFLDNMMRQQRYSQMENSLPKYLRLSASTGQTQADTARQDYQTKTLNPMIAEAMTSPLNGGQNSTFAAGRVAALQIAGGAEASRLAEQARSGAIDDIMRQRDSYWGAPVDGRGGGYGSRRTGAQTEAPGSSWLDRLPAYAQLAYGGTNALRYAMPYVSPFMHGIGSAIGGVAGGIGRGIRGLFGGGAPANPVAGGGYFGDGYSPTEQYVPHPSTGYYGDGYEPSRQYGGGF